MVHGLRTLITGLNRQRGFHEIPRLLQVRVGLEKKKSLFPSSCLLTIYDPYDSAEVSLTLWRRIFFLILAHSVYKM